MTIREATPVDEEVLISIWLRSVRATHSFLTEENVQDLLVAVRAGALRGLELWVLEAGGIPAGFMGLSGSKLEALFLAPEHSGKGGGRLLVQHARKLKGPLTTDVNEQNPQAMQFYQAMGFQVVGRSPVDDAGRPYPLLHLREAD